MVDIKIDKDIPMPIGSRYSPLLDLLATMKVGDSILVKNIKERDRLSAAMRRLDYSVVSRRVAEGYRLWRRKT